MTGLTTGPDDRPDEQVMEVLLRKRPLQVVNGRPPGFSVLASLLTVLALAGCNYAPQPSANPSADGAASPHAHTVARSDFPSQPSPGGEARDGDTVAVAGSGGRHSRRGRADRQAAPGAFDFYLLNLSWSPEFCATHGSSPECGRGLGFVVHGLWPQNENGTYPEDCSEAPGPANPGAYTDIIPTASLVEHEWQTHGTCSGLSADAYFAEVRKAFATVKIPQDVGTNGGAVSETPNQLVADFARSNPTFPAGSIALSCGTNHLTAVEICLTKNLQPESCVGVRSCRANVIQITPK